VVTRVVDSGVVSRNDASDLRSVIIRLDEEINDLGRVSNQLQEGVMRMRMVPVKALLSRVPRLVRDLALREGRQVHVRFSGEETELDKTVIEQLSDPLVHLIRNAISHGLETPAARTAAGKPAEGTLEIRAHHEGNMVILEVEDDGRGIDLERIRQRLVASGAAQAGDADRMSERELLSAVFLPGFSTSDSISDVSGRGVGLDVVKRNIEQLGGQVEVFTGPGARPGSRCASR
jgi:two-component system chemotaxis sensor kinase CheA